MYSGSPPYLEVDEVSKNFQNEGDVRLPIKMRGVSIEGVFNKKGGCLIFCLICLEDKAHIAIL